MIEIHTLIAGKTSKYFRFDQDPDPRINKDHLSMVPTCGEIPDDSQARISNTSPSDKRYPWVIQVIRTVSDAQTNCGGSIITER